MKDSKIKDERIISERRKIQSDAYAILVYCLIVSILIQQFFMKAPFAQFAVEFFCLIGAGVYMTIRHLSVEIDIWDSHTTSKKVLFNALFSGVIVVALHVFLTGEKNILNIVLVFIAFVSAYFIWHIVTSHIVRKRQNKIEESLDADEKNAE